ncbi:hypothetical protein [Prosthecodimorpha staleyi]|uniref:Uncharacterized protein n=1 Tax=Prosthecodimorpha staleyi TaxID=2840188 RepID=A0A947D8B7_9HYPH|nr:hypothetical protein [Prosthecodimorpha staleyi]MBT9290067.1 hypothetical protein [Prosthecodimorpha staleyi]
MSEISNGFSNGDTASYELQKLGFFRESAVLRWLSVRYKILSWVSARGNDFYSTEQALRIAILSAELSVVAENIIIAYSIGTMAEWDQYCKIDESDLAILENACTLIESGLNR